MLSAFDCSFWISPVVVRSAFQYINCFHVEAGKIEPLEFYERAHDKEYPKIVSQLGAHLDGDLRKDKRIAAIARLAREGEMDRAMSRPESPGSKRRFAPSGKVT